jgi:hypothetical protein
VPVTEEAFRDRDRDGNQASVLENFTGRATEQVSVECDLVPSGVAGTPTAPDADLLFKNAIGSRVTRTAHTTLAAASTTTLLNFTPGGVVASGTAVGDLIAVDVSASFGVEVRRVVSIATDAVTIDRALSAAPAAARSVYVGTKYLPSESDLASLHLFLFNINQLRYEAPGVVLNDFSINCNFAEGVPMVKARFAGVGKQEVAHTVTRATPVTAGSPLVPSVGKVWLGTVKHPIVDCSIGFKNGKDLRNNESDGLFPSAVKRTGNASRYVCEQTIQVLATEGASGTQQFYDGGRTRTAIDAIVQLGVAPGRMVAWTTRNWRPRGERTEIDGEVGFRLSGRALGTAGDDEVVLTVF